MSWWGRHPLGAVGVDVAVEADEGLAVVTPVVVVVIVVVDGRRNGVFLQQTKPQLWLIQLWSDESYDMLHCEGQQL